MKKYIITFAIAVLSLVSCGSKQTEAECMTEYEAAIEKLNQDYMEQVKDLGDSSKYTPEQAAKIAQEAEDKAVSQMVDLSLGAIKKFPDGKLAQEALQNIYYLATPEQLEDALTSLGDSLKTTDFVMQISKSLEAKKATKEGEMFTDFTVIQDTADVEGSKVSFSDYIGKGKYVLVDFWASWCGPCKQEIPNVKSVYEKYAGDDFDVLSIAVWDEPSETAAAAAEHGVVWHQIVNAQKIPTDLYGIDGIPQIMLFGPDGRIIKRDLRGADIESEVAKYVKAK